MTTSLSVFGKSISNKVYDCHADTVILVGGSNSKMAYINGRIGCLSVEKIDSVRSYFISETFNKIRFLCFPANHEGIIH